ncbi:type IV pilus assembly protein FimV [Leeia aquatica]|uniref:FimV N-terminal domain-containing protein n=1 Tax=Leeia aquatica TaxID=2725557 RepID=A0A847SEY7_9NEIS|nr:hypothetical protein [Leeia aquatica]NLR75996.1 hypothetical protein [Leeia aquatica]
MPEIPVLIRPSRIRQLILAALSCLVATPGVALVLGEARVRSHLGFPLSITVPFTADAGEEILPECIQLGGSGEGYIRGASIRVETQRSGGSIVIQTRAAMQEPVVRLYVQVSCSPKGQLARDYSLLLDPAPHGEPPAEQPAVASAYPLQWVAREGDSLIKLARQWYPGQSRNQQRFVQAALQANPQVSSSSQNIPAGVVLALPSPAQVRAVRLEPVSPPATDVATAPPAEVKPKPVVSKPAPQPKPAAPKPAGGSVSVTVGGVLPEPPQAPATGTFGLKLSYDLTEPATPMTEAQRAQLRQKMQLINSDDQLAYLLNLQTQMQQMQGELQQLKQQRGLPAAAPASVSATVPVTAAQPAATPAREEDGHWLRYGWWYAAGGLILLVMAWAAWRYRQRQESDNSWYFEDGPAPAQAEVDAPTQLTMVHPLDQPAPAGLREPAASNELDSVPLRNEQIVVEDGDRWAVEEAQVFLSHGWVEHAVSLLTEEVDKNPYHLDLWLMLFEIHKQHGMTDAFDALADRFRDIAYGLPIWDKVQAMRDEMHGGDTTAAEVTGATEEGADSLPAADAAPEAAPAEMMTLDVPPLSFELDEAAAPAPGAKVSKVAATPQASSDTLDFDLELTFDPPKEDELPPALTHSAGHAKAEPSPDFDLLDFEVDTPPPAEKPTRR